MDKDVPQTPVKNPRILNLGCGFKKFIGANAVNVDFMANCVPDILWDLNKVPWTWAKDESFDLIRAYHVLEHLTDWWPAFKECSRILKPGGLLDVRVPDESSSSALTYRDHHNAFTMFSFHGILDDDKVPHRSGTNAWALGFEGSVPFKIIYYAQVPYRRYDWMIRWAPWLLNFCAAHLRNFIWEQILVFQKVYSLQTNIGVSEHKPPDREGKNERGDVLPLRELYQGRQSMGDKKTPFLSEMFGEQDQTDESHSAGKTPAGSKTSEGVEVGQ